MGTCMCLLHALTASWLQHAGAPTSPWLIAGHEVWPTLADGTLKLPLKIRKVFIEVGTHMRTHFMDHVEQSEDVVVLCIEPQANVLDEHPKHPRLIFVKAAVGLRDTARQLNRTFKVFSGSGFQFSSFHEPSELGQTFLEGTGPEELKVEVITLEDIFERIPRRIEVSMIRIDAQGSDLEVVQSAGLHVRRAARIEIECQDVPAGDHRLVYLGQPTKSDFIPVLRVAGFILERCWMNNPTLAEENCIFARSDLKLNVRHDCFLDRFYQPFEFFDLSAAVRELPAEAFGAQGSALLRQNAAVYLEVQCCGLPSANISASDGCFDEELVYDECCFQAYMEAIDYIREPNRLQRVEEWRPGGAEVDTFLDIRSD